MGAPRTIIHAEYQIDLDRLPAQPAGCSGMLIVVMGAIMAATAGGLLLFTSSNAAAAPTPTLAIVEDATPTPTESPTLDSWAATGTALALATASPTVDYCFWLTPTQTALPTRAAVDEWSATGTAIYEATHPYQTATHTPDAPRAWCNNIPTLTPTLTALFIGTQATDTPAPTNTHTPVPTNTRQPTSNPDDGYIPPVPPAPPGFEVLPTVDLVDLPPVLPTVPATPTATHETESVLTSRTG